MIGLLSFPRERRARLFDGCQAALVWLAVLACVVSDPEVQRLALAAMVALALAAAFVALCPLPPGIAGTAAAPTQPSGNPDPRNKEEESDVL